MYGPLAFGVYLVFGAPHLQVKGLQAALREQGFRLLLASRPLAPCMAQTHGVYGGY